MDITAATRPVDKDGNPEMMATSSRNVDRDEDFNTRYASYRGWQMAIERVKPISRVIPRLDLTGMVLGAGCKTSWRPFATWRAASWLCPWTRLRVAPSPTS